MNRIRLAAASLLALMATPMAAPAVAQTQGISKTEVLVGSITDLSGPLAPFGKGLRNEPGTLAMARTNDPNSATAQFFINVADNAFLDPRPGNAGYTVFGKVVSGMDVVNKIKTVQTGNAGMHSDVPLTPVVIQSATIVK